VDQRRPAAEEGPRAGAAQPESPERTRLNHPHVAPPQEPRPRKLAASSTGTAHPAVSPLAHHMRRVPPRLLLSRLRVRGHHDQDMGLGAGRARADGEGTYQRCAGRGLWRAKRRNASGFMLKRFDDQAVGPLRRVQEHPDTAWTRPFCLGGSVHPEWSSRLTFIWQSTGLCFPRQDLTSVGCDNRLLCKNDPRACRLGTGRLAKF
jgi:hypothetical protein